MIKRFLAYTASIFELFTFLTGLMQIARPGPQSACQILEVPETVTGSINLHSYSCCDVVLRL